MPKVIDRDARREQIAQAVVRVIARHGLDGTTIREVAREAGCSTGVLAHYFRSKDEMLLYAFQVTTDRGVRRVERWQRESSGLESLRGALLDTLPLDEERGDEVRVWCRFLGQAASQPLMAAQQRLQEQRWRALLTGFIADGQRCGAFVEDLDAAAEAEALSVIVDGISLQAVFEPERLPADHQMRLLDRHLARLMAHPTGNVGEDDA